jgi:hypothetical protein
MAFKYIIAAIMSALIPQSAKLQTRYFCQIEKGLILEDLSPFSQVQVVAAVIIVIL